MAASNFDRYSAPRPPARGADSAPSFEGVLEPPALMLDLVLRSGRRVALPYGYLLQIELVGGETLTLRYPSEDWVITGRNLLPLYNNMVAHRAFRVAQNPDQFDDGAGVYIANIQSVAKAAAST